MKIQGLNYSQDGENNHQNPMLCMGLYTLLCAGWAYLTDLLCCGFKLTLLRVSLFISQFSQSRFRKILTSSQDFFSKVLDHYVVWFVSSRRLLITNYLWGMFSENGCWQSVTRLLGFGISRVLCYAQIGSSIKLYHFFNTSIQSISSLFRSLCLCCFRFATTPWMPICPKFVQ